MVFARHAFGEPSRLDASWADEALTWHGWLVVTFGPAGCPKKALKTDGAPTPVLHICPMVVDEFRRCLVDRGLAVKEP